MLRIGLHAIALPLLVWDARDNLWSWETFNSILYGTHSKVAWTLIAVSAGLYAFTYLHHRLHYALRKHIPVDPTLYAIAHVSIVNFILDLPGRGIPSARFTHVLIVAINIVAAITLLFTLHTVTPIQKAWGCYDPQFVSGLADYDRGMCPVDRDSNANICTERPYVNCEMDFGDNTFHKEIHYATQAGMVALVLYALSIGDKLTFYKLKAYTERE